MKQKKKKISEEKALKNFFAKNSELKLKQIEESIEKDRKLIENLRIYLGFDSLS